MTAAVTTHPAYPVRIAASTSVCGALGCHRLIEPGMWIIKPPGQPWRHANCDAPHAGYRSTPR